MADNKKIATPAASPSAAGLPQLKALTTNPLMYDPDTCGDVELCGFVHSFVQMPYALSEETGKKDQEWNALEIELAKPCKGKDADGDVKPAVVGEIVRVAIVKELESLVPHFREATRASKLLFVSVTPKEKIKLKGAKTMWKFSVLTDKDNPPSQKRDRASTTPYVIDIRSSDLGEMLGVDATGQLASVGAPQLNGSPAAPQLSA